MDPVTVIRAAIVAPARVEVIQFLAIGSRDRDGYRPLWIPPGVSRTSPGLRTRSHVQSFYCAFKLTTARRITSACPS